MTVEVRAASGRTRTEAEGRTTRHSFSFGAHYDPDNVGFGLLSAHNDELLPPGTGYPEHRHSGVEIVSVVLCGALRHTSPVGSDVLGPGGVQRLSAGTGVPHSEVSDADVPTRFIQSWVRASDPDAAPSYAATVVDPAAGLQPVVGGGSGIGIGADAVLYNGFLPCGVTVALPDAHRLHVFVAEGAVLLDGQRLGPAYAARLTDEGGREVVAALDTRLLVWAMP
jgi:redox-sensitive bicupin YhaK (pirin superfamily)